MSKLVDGPNGGKMNQFEPGESGNPNGKIPGTKNRATILKELLEINISVKHPGTKQNWKVTLEKAIDLALIRKALRGDIAAIREVKDTLFGKIATTLDIKTEQPLFPDDVQEDDSDK